MALAAAWEYSAYEMPTYTPMPASRTGLAPLPWPACKPSIAVAPAAGCRVCKLWSCSQAEAHKPVFGSRKPPCFLQRSWGAQAPARPV